MNLFLIVYDRRQRKLLEVEQFGAGQFDRANQVLFEFELAYPGMEVVLFEAASYDQLKLTHSRYFDDVPAQVEAAAAAS